MLRQAIGHWPKFFGELLEVRRASILLHWRMVHEYKAVQCLTQLDKQGDPLPPTLPRLARHVECALSDPLRAAQCTLYLPCKPWRC